MELDDKLPEIAGASGLTGHPEPALLQDESDKQHVSLPDIQGREDHSSTESLIKALGLAGADQKSLGRLLKSVRGQVLSTLDELRTITTHDDNLERQYKEVVAENTQLNSALEKARGDIRHLKGQLSVLQMTSPEIRKHRARAQLRERRKLDHERQIQQSRSKYAEELVPMLNVAERACTVNAMGEYVDHRRPTYTRHATYPPSSVSPGPLMASTRQRTDPLPPPLLGCKCSVCNAQQSLGALTIGSRHTHQQQQPRSTLHFTKSGQQILLGDRAIVKGEKPGVVRYIGKLESDILGQLFIGVHLDMPVGTCDGSLRGCHYFQCPPHHGVFVKPGDVICVTGRKPCTGGTTVPRVQERLPAGIDASRASSKDSGKKTPLHWKKELQSPTPSSTRTASTMTHAHNTVQEELARANTMSPDELFDASVQEMSDRIAALARKNKPKQPAAPEEHTKQAKHLKEMQPAKPSPSPSPVPEDTTGQPHTSPKPSPLPPPPQRGPTPHSPSPTPSPRPHLLSKPTPSPPPLPVVHAMTPPPERATTPLEMTLLRALQSKDLGNTGFVTGKEIASSLTHLSKGKAMSVEQTEELLDQLGIPRTESGGFPYNDVIPYLVQAIEGTQ